MADINYQQQVWVKKQYPPGVQYDDFDRVVHVLMDDTLLKDAPEKTIGTILEDEAEMHVVTAVIGAIDHVLKMHGTELTDEEYIHTAEWTQVVETAQAALLVMKKNTMTPAST